MNELRSIVTVVSLLTFIGIVWWAWRPGSKQKAEIVMSDMLMDDDRKPHASILSQGVEK
jgi:cbb3-type cytochrome oxidase subunit 3